MSGHNGGVVEAVKIRLEQPECPRRFLHLATVMDSDGATASNSASATVSNVPPHLISLSPQA